MAQRTIGHTRSGQFRLLTSGFRVLVLKFWMPRADTRNEVVISGYVRTVWRPPRDARKGMGPMKKWSIVAALVVLATIAALPAVAGGNGKGKGGASTAEGHLVVPDGTWGGTVDAAANPGGENVYVFAQCWLQDGTYVFAAYYPVIGGQASVGPLKATTWPNAAANCTAKEGYFMRDGWGKWVTLAEDAFSVAAA
jgi:hypothetical protein